MILTVILLVLGMIHFYWAAGGLRGIDKALPTNLDGQKLFSPGVITTVIVGLVLLSFSYIVFELYQGNKTSWIEKAGWGILILFFVRAMGDFHYVGLFKKEKTTVFSRYDTWLYTPLCLFISIDMFLILMH
jgi:hypothetical protein